jgi:hypothetical protein
VERRRQEFTEFYTSAKDDCLRIVLVSVGDRQLAEDLVAEAFTRQVELTLRELQDQARLEQTLADAGVPAIVSFGRFCEPVNPADNLTATTGTHFIQRPVGRAGVLVGILIDPAAIPSGVTVDIGVEDFGTGHGYFVDEIIKNGAPLTCHPIHRVKVKEPPAATPGA